MGSDGTAAQAVKEAYDLFTGKLKKLYEENKTEECRDVINQLKVLFTQFPTFLNPEADTPTRKQEVMLVREVMEHAVLLAASSKNMVDFERHFEILRVYYNDFKDDSEPSERRLLVLGLHLLRLLATNETRTFHMELERIAVEEQSNMYIVDVIQLERYIMEGSYHKMLQASKKVPSKHYVPLMELLLEAVRREVFKCAIRAYETLSVQGACKLLMFSDVKELHAFVEEEKKKEAEATHAWTLKGDVYTFQETQIKKDTLPHSAIIQNQLQYSHELQRIA